MPLVFEDDIVDVGIVLFDGVQIIDYTGPYEVFGHASYRVYTVSESGEPLTTAMGMRVEPSYSFKNSPQADVLVIPGGNLHDAVDNRRLISWVTTQAKAAKQVLSVCNGAFILAKTGLLDHKKATTFHRLLEKFEATAAKTEVVWDQRFVDNGKIITTAGLSSGIDGALHVVSKLDGHGTAAGVALHLEYDWRPDENYARAALADMYLPRIAAPDGSQIKVVKTEGSRSTWTKEYRLHGKDRDSAAAYFYAQIDKLKWTPEASSIDASNQRRWTFEDRHGRRWTAQTLFSNAGDTSNFRIETRLAER